MDRGGFDEAIQNLLADSSPTEAINALARYSAPPVTRYLIRALGHRTGAVRSAAVAALERRGRGDFAAATAEAVTGWNVAGLPGALNDEDTNRVFDIVFEAVDKARTSYYSDRNTEVERALSGATADQFVRRLSSASAWEWVAKQLEAKRATTLAAIVNASFDSPIPFDRDDAVEALPALIFALVSGIPREPRLVALVRHVVDRSDARERLVVEMCEEDALLDAAPRRTEEEPRLLRLAGAFGVAELRARACSALGSTDYGVSKAAAYLLRAIGDSASVDLIARALGTDGLAVVDELVHHADASLLLPSLERRIEERDGNEAALLAVWRTQGEAALDRFARLAANKSDGFAETVRAFLGKWCGALAVRPIVKALDRADRDARSTLQDLLATVSPPDEVLRLLVDQTTQSLGITLARLRGDDWSQAVDVFLALSSSLAHVRRDAAMAAGALPADWTPVLIPRLARLLTDEAELVRAAALATLGTLQDTAVLPALIDRLGRTGAGLDRERLTGAIASRDEGEGSFRDCLASDRPARRRGALLFVAQRGVPPSLLGLVRDALRSADPDTRCAAAACIARARDLRAVCPLLSLATDAEQRVRVAAGEALRVVAPALSSLAPVSAGDLRSLAGEVYGWLLSSTSTAVQSTRIADAHAVGEVFGATPAAVAELMTALEGAKDAARLPAQVAGARIAATVALCTAADCARRRDFTSATHLQKQIAELAARLSEPEIEWHAWSAVGSHCEDLGDDSAAWSALLRASEVIDRIWFALLDEPGRDFFKGKAVLYDRLVRCALRLGYDAAAFEFSEKAKTRYLGDLIVRRQRARRTELSPTASELLVAFDRARGQPSGAEDHASVSPVANVVTDFAWGLPLADASSWLPRWLAEWEQSTRSPAHGMPQDVWRIGAWLRRESTAETEAAEAPLEEIHAILTAVRGLLRSRSVATAADRDEWLQHFDAAARRLWEIRAPAGVPLGIFTDYSPALGRLIDRAASDPETGAVELNALLEALDGALRQAPVEAVRVERTVEREQVLATVAPAKVVADSPAPHPTLEDAVAAVRATEWRYVAQIVRGVPVSYQRVRQAVSRVERSALVQFHITEKGIVAFLVHADAASPHCGPELFTFPEVTAGTLDRLLFDAAGWFPQLDAWRNGQITADQWEEGTEHVLSQLHARLFAPLEQRLHALGVQRLLLVPHRALQALPLHALCRVQGGRRRYVIDDFEVAYAPSSTLAEIAGQRHALAYQNRNALCVHAPAGDIPYTRMEVAAVAARFRAAPVNGDLAAIRGTAPLRSHFHFAGHAAYDPQSPLDSRLQLTSEPHLDVGALFDNAISLSRLELATLSVCDTGLTDPRDTADEYIGISGGFLFAGVANVLCTLWPVEDVATTLFVDRFYATLLSASDADGRRPAARALREAQLWLRDLTRWELRKHLRREDCGFEDAAKEEIGRAFAERVRTHGKRPFAKPIYWAPFVMSSGFPSDR